jgi:predicted nucleic acid-binding protein
MKLIDTNIFLEILLNQSRAEIAKKTLFDLFKSNEPFIVSSFTIHSIVVILENKKKLSELKLFIESLAQIDAIIFYYPDFDEEKEIIENMSQWKLDFDDAFQYYIARKMDAQIITFDHDFKKVKKELVVIL